MRPNCFDSTLASYTLPPRCGTCCTAWGGLDRSRGGGPGIATSRPVRRGASRTGRALKKPVERGRSGGILSQTLDQKKGADQYPWAGRDEICCGALADGLQSPSAAQLPERNDASGLCQSVSPSWLRPAAYAGARQGGEWSIPRINGDWSGAVSQGGYCDCRVTIDGCK